MKALLSNVVVADNLAQAAGGPDWPRLMMRAMQATAAKAVAEEVEEAAAFAAVALVEVAEAAADVGSMHYSTVEQVAEAIAEVCIRRRRQRLLPFPYR